MAWPTACAGVCFVLQRGDVELMIWRRDWLGGGHNPQFVGGLELQVGQSVPQAFGLESLLDGPQPIRPLRVARAGVVAQEVRVVDQPGGHGLKITADDNAAPFIGRRIASVR